MTDRETLTLATFGLMLWREARGEPEEGIIAVAHTVIERIARPKWWSEPHHDVLSVIMKPYQYTSMTHRNDPQLFSMPAPHDGWFAKCMFIAEQVMAGATTHPAPSASHYFNPDTVVVVPYWTRDETAKFITKIGRHDFWYVFS